MPRLAFVGQLFLALVSVVTFASAFEGEPGSDDKLRAKRYELMTERMATVKVSSEVKDFPERLSAKPIFRYTDPARSYVAAAVWKLGDKGRPAAFIITELHRRFQGSPRIVYEYLSLTSLKFTATGDDFSWYPAGTDLQFKPIPKAPAPEATAPKRLLQLREMARRFAGSELVGQEKCELRLLPQPIDRYVPSDAERADGAVFLLTFGTNPEVALLIESDGKSWTFAAGRMTGASKVAVTIDSETAWEGLPLQRGFDSKYTGSNAPAKIPGIDFEGNEITP